LVNEIAPRVHNSGHWTLDGASISQFEQHIRAIAGWPLGKPVRHGLVTMTNLIGDDIHNYEQWLTVPGATVHLYGKGPARPGRKMGHVTQVDAMPPKPRDWGQIAGLARVLRSLSRSGRWTFPL
jgi:5-(carboxyamino)imidazole ribonucleotide synthase